jgi:diguanylate cyclase (GGDEF)-like protein
LTIPIRVLVLEDNPGDAELMIRRLRQAGFDCEWQRVETEGAYQAQLNPKLHLILADYSLPQYDALRALQHLQTRHLDIPFIVVTGMLGEEAAVECMKQGAADYLLKDRLARLAPAVVHALEQKHVRDEKRRAEAVQAAIFKIAQAANTVTNLNDVFRSIHSILGELMPVQNFYIALYDAVRDEISFPYWVDQYDAAAPSQKPGHGLTEYVLRTGQPQWVTPDMFRTLVAQGEVDLIGTPSVDWVGVPLKIEDRIIGVMAVQSYTEALRFGQAEADILSFVSAQVAMTIERKRAEEALRYLAVTDPLTGLYNRHRFFELASREFERARRYAHPLSIIIIDIDNLKPINDTHGHLAGDCLIQSIGSECTRQLRKTDVLGRYGGDEFIALLPETELSETLQVIDRLREHIAQTPVSFEDQSLPTTISVGVAGLERDCSGIEDLLARADKALYAAKQAGKNRVSVWKN